MAKFLIIITGMLISLYSFGQTGTIKGTIKTSDGQPAEYVSIGLKGTSKGTSANSKGEFEIKNVSPGNYILIVSFTGLQTKEINLEVKANETTTVSEVTLEEDAQTLEEVVIQGIKNPKPSSKQLNRMPINYMEDIQSYSVVTKETIKEIGATDFSSALRGVPGAGAATQTGYGYSALYLRGFQTEPRFRNGIYGITHGAGDPQNLENIEVLRGPAGIFYNSPAGPTYGGIVNRVTKTAFNGKLIELGGAFGSYNLNRFTADVNVPLNDKVYLRVNGAYQTDPSWQNMHMIRRDMLLAPVLVYKVNDKLYFKLEAELNSNYMPQTFYFDPNGLDLSAPKSMRDLKMDYNTNYANPSFTYIRPTSTKFYAASANYEFNEKWKLSADFQRSDMNHFTGIVRSAFINDTLMARNWYDFDYRGQVNSGQINLNGNIKTGSIQHKLLLGASMLYQFDGNNGKYTGFGFPNVDTLNLNSGAVPYMDADALRATSGVTTFNGRAKTYIGSVYLADQIDVTDRLHAMLSVGLNWFKDPIGGFIDYSTPNLAAQPSEKIALNPRLGLVYEVIKGKASVFGNYTSAASRLRPTLFQTFRPEYSTQLEGGVKVSFLNDKITSTISYYNINITNALRQDPNNIQLRIQDANSLSEGIDAEIVGNLFSGFKLIAGYGYNNRVFVKSDERIQNKRPAGTAFHNANVWATYTIQTGNLKGLGVGLGGNHLGESYFNDVNTLIIPAYTVLNSTLFYNAEKWRLGVNLNNMTNQKYWNFAGTPQRPVNLLASLSVKI